MGVHLLHMTFGTITVSSWPGLSPGAGDEHLLVVMDSTELTDNLYL